MTGINADELARLQEDWGNANSGILSLAHQYLSDLRRIKQSLEKMGLDLTQDATYDLLAPGLTKYNFDQHDTYLHMLSVLRDYNTMQKQHHDFVGVQAQFHYTGLKRLLEFTYPRYEQALKNAPLPAKNTINPLHLRELEFITSLNDDGTLKQYLKQAALQAALDEYRNVYRAKSKVEEQISKGEEFYRDSSQGLAYSKALLEYIDAADDAYAAQNIPANYGFFGGWDNDAGTIEFSRKNAEEFRDYFIAKQLGNKFSNALDWQAKGEYVLDASGSGHGAMVMPMQDIATELKGYGYDLNDPATFTMIGTDIATFSKAYHDERNAVLKNDQYNLVKPALKI